MRRAVLLVLVLSLVTAGTLGSAGVAQVATPPPQTVTIAAVGDIACKNPPKNNRRMCRHDDVAKGIRRGDYDAFLALGDVQYEYGLYREFIAN